MLIPVTQVDRERRLRRRATFFSGPWGASAIDSQMSRCVYAIFGRTSTDSMNQRMTANKHLCAGFQTLLDLTTQTSYYLLEQRDET
jgi:hypothetical protein